MFMDRPAVQDPGFTDRVMVEVTPVQVFRVTKVDRVIKAIRATRVVIINKGISSSNSQVTRVTRSSLIVSSIMSSPLACASMTRSFIKE